MPTMEKLTISGAAMVAQKCDQESGGDARRRNPDQYCKDCEVGIRACKLLHRAEAVIVEHPTCRYCANLTDVSPEKGRGSRTYVGGCAFGLSPKSCGDKFHDIYPLTATRYPITVSPTVPAP